MDSSDIFCLLLTVWFFNKQIYFLFLLGSACIICQNNLIAVNLQQPTSSFSVSSILNQMFFRNSVESIYRSARQFIKLGRCLTCHYYCDYQEVKFCNFLPFGFGITALYISVARHCSSPVQRMDLYVLQYKSATQGARRH